MKIIQLQILQLGHGLQDMSGMILVLKIIKIIKMVFIFQGEAVIKGYQFMNKKDLPPQP